jgi:hypothetical protein
MPVKGVCIGRQSYSASSMCAAQHNCLCNCDPQAVAGAVVASKMFSYIARLQSELQEPMAVILEDPYTLQPVSVQQDTPQVPARSCRIIQRMTGAIPSDTICLERPLHQVDCMALLVHSILVLSNVDCQIQCHLVGTLPASCIVSNCLKRTKCHCHIRVVDDWQ